jgi:membrane-bound lytic murein transglycosylase D
MRWWLLLLLTSTASAAPLFEDSLQRRAIRGTAVDTVRESAELKALREFEEEQFPKPGIGAWPDDDQLGVEPRSSSLTDGLGPDAIPPALRSPETLKAAPPAAPSAIPWLDELKLPDLPVRFDPRVVRYLEFYKSDRRGRAIMSSWLKAQGRWRPMMEEALRRAHLPLSLFYVSMIESGFDPYDRSHAGAVGLWQFMPEVAHVYGLRVDYWIDERRDPERATEAQMHYFVDLKERFGSWPLALAAFNAGYGAVLRAMQKYNTNDYWELCRHEDGLPWETVLYVPKAMAVALVGENRHKLGYDDVAADRPFTFDRAPVPTSMSLTQIAKAAGVPAAEVIALNPELRRQRTPPSASGERWQVRLPRGSGARFAAAYESHKEAVRPWIVRFGERLDDLAQAHGISAHQLRALNGIEDSGEVTPGLVLVVPDGKKASLPPPCETVIVPVPDKDAVVAGRKRLFYRTLPQDSLHDVANFFKVKVVDLSRWNHLDLDAKLASNMVLQVWVEPAFDESRAALVDPARVRVVTTGSDEFFDLVEARRGRARLVYTVKKGDDLKKIGKKYGLTVADLERINRFGANHTDLVIGQKVVVYRAMTKEEKELAACRLIPGGTEVAHQPPAAPEGAFGPAPRPDDAPSAAPRVDEAARADADTFGPAPRPGDSPRADADTFGPAPRPDDSPSADPDTFGPAARPDEPTEPDDSPSVPLPRPPPPDGRP